MDFIILHKHNKIKGKNNNVFFFFIKLIHKVGFPISTTTSTTATSVKDMPTDLPSEDSKIRSVPDTNAHKWRNHVLQNSARTHEEKEYLLQQSPI